MQTIHKPFDNALGKGVTYEASKAVQNLLIDLGRYRQARHMTSAILPSNDIPNAHSLQAFDFHSNNIRASPYVRIGEIGKHYQS
jgi:hypothetical protein